MTLLISYAFICMTRACFNAAMSTIVDMGVFTKTQTGIISAVFYAIYGVLQVAGGILTDRKNPEHLITVGFVGAAISNLVIYFNHDFPEYQSLHSKLGKVKPSTGCVYINKLVDIDLDVLAQMLAEGVDAMKRCWPVTAT
jgi:MFS family permease